MLALFVLGHLSPLFLFSLSFLPTWASYPIAFVLLVLGHLAQLYLFSCSVLPVFGHLAPLHLVFLFFFDVLGHITSLCLHPLSFLAWSDFACLMPCSVFLNLFAPLFSPFSTQMGDPEADFDAWCVLGDPYPSVFSFLTLLFPCTLVCLVLALNSLECVFWRTPLYFLLLFCHHVPKEI